VLDPVAQVGRQLVQSSDCMRCHAISRKTVGPSFQEIAARYAPDPNAQTYLAGKIVQGSVGVWGRIIMPRHPQVSQDDALKMAAWVMAQKKTVVQ
jgi:cytochrome c